MWVSFLFSTIVMLANIGWKQYFPTLLQSPINAGVFCMLAGLIIVPVVSLFTKAPSQEHIEHVFSCYDTKVIVPVTEAIGEPIFKEETK